MTQTPIEKVKELEESIEKEDFLLKRLAEREKLRGIIDCYKAELEFLESCKFFHRSYECTHCNRIQKLNEAIKEGEK